MGYKKGDYGESHGESVICITRWSRGESLEFSFAKWEACALISVDYVMDGIHLALHRLGIDDAKYVRW